MRSTKFGLLPLFLACILTAFPPTAFAEGKHVKAATVSEYRVEYKLHNPKTGATGELHVTYVRAESESNVLAELRRQNPGKDVVVLSLVRK
jgi:hypothetical protein